MGIFSAIKKLFDKSIYLNFEMENRLSYYYFARGRKIFINSFIIVPDETVALMVYNNKITDIVPSGKHRINEQILPNTFKRIREGSYHNGGVRKKRFKADIYFVNLDDISKVYFNAVSPFKVRSKTFGSVLGFAEGTCAVRIIEPEKLFIYLLQGEKFLKDDKALRILGNNIGNYVDKVIENSGFDLENIVKNDESFLDYLNDLASDAFVKIGIKVKNVELLSFRFNKKTQTKIAEFLENQHNGLNIKNDNESNNLSKILNGKISIEK